MVETLVHPLNQPCFDEAGKIMAGYTIIQPRVSPTLPSTNGSIFSRLFSDAVGVDPYTQLVSDVYQDLSGEGSYHGKGIYDVRAFSRIPNGRLPAERVLSHDLLEGSYVRVALASDIELYDDFPLEYQKYNSRAHRWIRGDWQIAGWLLPRVPRPAGTSEPNPLSMLTRWKIFDNLRRSLLPAASLALLVAAWLVSSRAGAIVSLVVGLQLFFQPLTMATTSGGDLQILKVEVPFLKAPLLTEEQHEVFSIPEVTLERATLFEHCRRAVSRGLTIGPHGLPLIGTGDWNDGLNLVGAEGRGESVWLGWFLCDLLQGMVEMARLLLQPEMSLSYQEERSALIEHIEKAGWDGEWYLRGTFDDGSPLGSAGNLEARINSLPQSWARLCGAADPQPGICLAASGAPG